MILLAFLLVKFVPHSCVVKMMLDAWLVIVLLGFCLVKLVLAVPVLKMLVVLLPLPLLKMCCLAFPSWMKMSPPALED